MLDLGPQPEGFHGFGHRHSRRQGNFGKFVRFQGDGHKKGRKAPRIYPRPMSSDGPRLPLPLVWGFGKYHGPLGTTLFGQLQESHR